VISCQLSVISCQRTKSSLADLRALAQSGRLLQCIRLGYADRQRANAADDAHPFGDADSSARIEQIEQVRASEGQFIRCQQRKAPLFDRTRVFFRQQFVYLAQQALRLGLVKPEMLQSLSTSANSKL